MGLEDNNFCGLDAGTYESGLLFLDYPTQIEVWPNPKNKF